jgi:hypothetical protein
MASDLGLWESRLWESNPRPTHYESFRGHVRGRPPEYVSAGQVRFADIDRHR